jgi:acetyl-CoA C-acetyltransferase
MECGGMRRVVIVSPVRAAVGAFDGALRDVPAEELAPIVIREAVARPGVNPPASMTSCSPSLTPTSRPAHRSVGRAERRAAAGGAGYAARPPLRVVITAIMEVLTGPADVLIADGIESMSNIELYTQDARWGPLRRRDYAARSPRSGATPFPAGAGVRRHLRHDRDRRESGHEYGITQEDADGLAARSQQRAAAFGEELVPMPIPQRRATPSSWPGTRGMRLNTTTGMLARLRPVMTRAGSDLIHGPLGIGGPSVLKRSAIRP